MAQLGCPTCGATFLCGYDRPLGLGGQTGSLAYVCVHVDSKMLQCVMSLRVDTHQSDAAIMYQELLVQVIVIKVSHLTAIPIMP